MTVGPAPSSGAARGRFRVGEPGPKTRREATGQAATGRAVAAAGGMTRSCAA
ncbi:hypothetical protein GCM10010255_80580 [Streptomyces coeruleofuscus]|uniref:Uncharacterized protein n=1 Tax=Streptomyces coeruleofuscus TaxID=66879 RepID=A0ABN3JBA0_9ACTN